MPRPHARTWLIASALVLAACSGGGAPSGQAGPPTLSGVVFDVYGGTGSQPTITLERHQGPAGRVGIGVSAPDGRLQSVTETGSLDSGGQLSVRLPNPDEIAPFVKSPLKDEVLPGLKQLPCPVNIASSDAAALGVSVWPYAVLPGSDFRNPLFGYHSYQYQTTQAGTTIDYDRSLLVYADRPTRLSASGSCAGGELTGLQYQIDAPLKAGWNLLALTVHLETTSGPQGAATSGSLQLLGSQDFPAKWGLLSVPILPF